MKLENYKLLGTIREHEYYISSLAVTPDGEMFISGSCDGTIKILNLKTGELVHNLTGHSDSVWSVAITPDGQTLVYWFY
jgi:WD40 repeat protein